MQHEQRGQNANELFIAGVRGWEVDLRRRIDEGRSKLDGQ